MANYAESLTSQLDIDLDKVRREILEEKEEEKKLFDDPTPKEIASRKIPPSKPLRNDYTNVCYSSDEDDKPQKTSRCSYCFREFAAGAEITVAKIELICPFCGASDPVWKGLDADWMDIKQRSDDNLNMDLVSMYNDVGWRESFDDEIVTSQALMKDLSKRLSDLCILQLKKEAKQASICKRYLDSLQDELDKFKKDFLNSTFFTRSTNERDRYNRNLKPDSIDLGMNDYSSNNDVGWYDNGNNSFHNRVDDNSCVRGINDASDFGNRDNERWDHGRFSKYSESSGGYGFITSELDGNEVYFHSQEIEYMVLNKDVCNKHPNDLSSHHYTPHLERMRKVKFVRKRRKKGLYADKLQYEDGKLIEAVFSCKRCRKEL
eukprot:235715_1